jgi:DNA-binding response OmpR family regulator
LGIDLLPQLRQHGVNLPAVFLTAHALPAHEIMAFDKGAIDFIDKGRGVDVFVKRMNALGFSADFTGASMEAWKKQSANGYMTISAHDTEAKPLFPDNTLHAALDAKVWTVAAVCALFCQRVIVSGMLALEFRSK